MVEKRKKKKKRGWRDAAGWKMRLTTQKTET